MDISSLISARRARAKAHLSFCGIHVLTTNPVARVQPAEKPAAPQPRPFPNPHSLTDREIANRQAAARDGIVV